LSNLRAVWRNWHVAGGFLAAGSALNEELFAAARRGGGPSAQAIQAEVTLRLRVLRQPA
jgi:hypothetical protein